MYWIIFDFFNAGIRSFRQFARCVLGSSVKGTMMNKSLLMIGLAVLLSACGEKTEKVAEAPAEAPKAAEQATAPAQQAAALAVDKAVLAEEAKAAVQALGSTLKGELEAAMKAGGPVEAMGICHTKAPKLPKPFLPKKVCKLAASV